MRQLVVDDLEDLISAQSRQGLAAEVVAGPDETVGCGRYVQLHRVPREEAFLRLCVCPGPANRAVSEKDTLLLSLSLDPPVRRRG